MLRRPPLLTLLLGVLLLASQAHAASLLSPDSSGTSLNGQIELLEDIGGQLSIADMADPAVQSRFQPAAGRTSVGQSRNPWWIRLSLQRTAEAPSQWWLEVGAVTLFDLQLYLPDAQGGGRCARRVSALALPRAATTTTAARCFACRS